MTDKLDSIDEIVEETVAPVPRRRSTEEVLDNPNVVKNTSYVVPSDIDLHSGGTFASLSPIGRKYGTWAVIRKSARGDSWDIVIPDVGSAKMANQLVDLMNSIGSQTGPDNA